MNPKNQGIRQDIEFYKQIFHAIGQAVIVTDVNGLVLNWNKAAEVLYGWTEAEVLNKSILEVTPSPEYKEVAASIMDKLKVGETWSGEFQVQKKDGTLFPAYVSDSPVFNSKKELITVIGVSHDLTSQKAREQEIQRLLDETQFVLKESQHRMKNNLLSVSGILTVKADKLPSGAYQSVIREAIAQIESMGFLYDRLYQAGDSLHITVEYIFSRLVDDILKVLSPQFPLETQLHCDSLHLSSQQLFVLSILINELVTNTVKYGYPDSTPGLIEIDFVQEDPKFFTFRYADTGVGLPATDLVPGFGLQLLDLLAKQLQGTLVQLFSPGYSIEIRHIPLMFQD
jgi:PAS domain S-box-containing protein